MKKLIHMPVTILLLAVFTSLSAQTVNDTITYTRREVMITMRDGVRLNTLILAPSGVKEPLPILLSRTPYGVSDKASPNRDQYVNDMAKEGYIFVYQDIRGRYRSEGVFVMQRPMRDRKDLSATDESTDTYDSIDWLIKNVPGNNGKAGMLGISYDGWTTMMGTIDPHPALKAASEQATPSDMYIGDDFHHNGAFRLSYAFEYAYMTEFARENILFPFDTYDTYDWYLHLGALSNVNAKFFHDKLPSWNDFVNHPDYDEFWQEQSLPYRLTVPAVPLLHVAGWWDQEDYYGPLKAYEVLEKNDKSGINFIVIGPWNHGGWGGGKGDRLGRIKFGTPTSEKFRKDIQAPFFAFYLKGNGTGDFPEASIFQTGSNVWKNYSEWPPVSSTAEKNLYLNSNGKLSFIKPAETGAYDEFLSDPAHPVPYRPRPVEMTYGPNSRWYTWLLEDQRFVDNRPDVASWKSDVLTDDIVVTGNLIADIFASTTGSDADWVVKLIDVYPEQYTEETYLSGYQLMIANDVFRGRYRKSYSNPEPLKPGEVYEFKIDLHAVNHVFRKGHRIMVQIQSTWFPLIDRNPQKYVPSIFEAKESDFITAQHRIFRSPEYPSHIRVPVSK